MPAGKLDPQKYNNMVNNASGGVVISSQIFKEFIADLKDKIESNYDLMTGDLTLQRLRISAENDASLTSTLHGFQVGPTNGQNIVMDGNEILARNNGATAILGLNYDGGSVHINAGTKLIRFDNGSIFLEGKMITTGSGSPEGVVTAPVGSIYLRTDGGATTTLYVKTSGSGNTGWTAK